MTTKLHLCCGARNEPGWINMDRDPPADIRHDVRVGLPYEDESFTHIYSEHAIEHFTKAEGLQLLRECRRVLKPGGVLRLSTPDLRYLVALYTSASRSLDPHQWGSGEMNAAANHGRESVFAAGRATLRAYKDVGFVAESPAQLINDGMRNWGHLYLYDEMELEIALKASGFKRVRREQYQKTAVPEMITEGRPDCNELIMEASR